MTFTLSRVVATMALAAAACAQVQSGGAQDNAEWTRPFPPFRMIGNVYWVGSYDLSTYLITSPQGHILKLRPPLPFSAGLASFFSRS